jgi:hypothetical protein
VPDWTRRPRLPTSRFAAEGAGSTSTGIIAGNAAPRSSASGRISATPRRISAVGTARMCIGATPTNTGLKMPLTALQHLPTGYGLGGTQNLNSHGHSNRSSERPEGRFRGHAAFRVSDAPVEELARIAIKAKSVSARNLAVLTMSRTNAEDAEDAEDAEAKTALRGKKWAGSKWQFFPCCSRLPSSTSSISAFGRALIVTAGVGDVRARTFTAKEPDESGRFMVGEN